MRPFNRSIIYAASLLASHSLTVSAQKPPPSVVQAEQVLAHKKTLSGRIISVQGFVRFDRPSEQGFLYSTMKDLRNQNYHRAIFLELGNEGFASLQIPDGRSAIVTGYLSKGLRGPLGAYGHTLLILSSTKSKFCRDQKKEQRVWKKGARVGLHRFLGQWAKGQNPKV